MYLNDVIRQETGHDKKKNQNISLMTMMDNFNYDQNFIKKQVKVFETT